MKLTILFLTTFLLQVSASSFGQKITFKQKKASLERVFEEVTRQTGYNIVCETSLKNKAAVQDVNFVNADMETVLGKFFESKELSYVTKNNVIVISEEERSVFDGIMDYFSAIDLSGKVVDERGQPIAGATVSLKGDKRSIKTNNDGSFLFKSLDENALLIISFIGYATQEVSVKASKRPLVITLKQEVKQIDDVIITGIVERKKESFTGAITSVSGEKLRSVGTQNVIQSLKSLDPSFIVLDDNLKGSNPNALASIEVRGKTSISTGSNSAVISDQFASDPNQPLFILDGFESSLRQITDLDINRVASITILKDAASTALYGARSANGVVVVETVKPKPGEVHIQYSADFRIEVPDLGDYDMMNSKEKLEYEVLAGRYASPVVRKDYLLLTLYNNRLREVASGVDTYWLNEPLRNGLTQKHSVYVDGGSTEFQYGLGLSLQNISGVMKGSRRNNWETRADLSYRKNKINISNRIYISGNRSEESLYGSFATYVKINPYYKKNYTDRYLETVALPTSTTEVSTIPNVLYNTTLNSDNYIKNLNLQNSLNMNLDLNRDLRISLGAQVSKSFGNTVNFISPLNTAFENTTLLEKGSYTDTRSESLAYSGNLMVSYNKSIKEKHVIAVNLRGDVQESNNNSLGLTAVGFPLGVEGNPIFAYSYQQNSKPSVFTAPTVRRVNALVSLNYVYDNRFLLDATYRIDGSTAFGSANKYSPFWSTGLGWRLNNERFMEGVDWLNQLTVRANIGSTGNQGFGSFASTTVYNLENNSNYFGQGLFHTSLGNPNLNWQKTLQANVGLDLAAMDRRLSATVNAYNKYTNPLIVALDLPGSNGILSYPMNIGNLNVKGIETSISYSPIYKLSERIIWTLGITAGAYKSRYGSIGNALNNLNALQLQSNSIRRFTDGSSPDDIWAVPSLGIDPSNGDEVFLTKEGTYTYTYNTQDIRVVANARPKVEGVISSSLRLKGFTASAYIRYNLGASRFNTALYEKVENISLYDLAFNQDRRALYGRWKNPGDVSQFKGISSTAYTPISSRFVQKENVITGESISLGYELQSKTTPWLKTVNLSNLRFTAYMNNIFRLSNIMSERGIDYPFANAVSFSLNASF